MPCSVPPEGPWLRSREPGWCAERLRHLPGGTSGFSCQEGPFPARGPGESQLASGGKTAVGAQCADSGWAPPGQPF